VIFHDTSRNRRLVSGRRLSSEWLGKSAFYNSPFTNLEKCMSSNTQKTKDAVQDVVDDVTDAAHDVKNKVDDAAHDAKNAVEDAAHDAKNDAKDAAK
jgi:gas vesicle protein